VLAAASDYREDDHHAEAIKEILDVSHGSPM